MCMIERDCVEVVFLGFGFILLFFFFMLIYLLWWLVKNLLKKMKFYCKILVGLFLLNF